MSKYSLLQHQKNLKAEKLRGYPLGFFNIHSVAKLQKIEGDPVAKIFFSESPSAEKTERVPFGLVRFCMLRGKAFWLFPGLIGAI